MQKNQHTDSSSYQFIDKELALHKFFESAPMMMGIVDVEGEGEDIRHIYDNHSASVFFDVPPELMSGKTASELGIPRKAIMGWLQHYEKAESNCGPVRFEYEHQDRGDAKYFAVVVSFIGKNSNGSSRFSYIVQDVTEMRRTQLELEKANTQLEARIRERTEELEFQKTKLQCLVQSPPLGIAFLDTNLRYEVINPMLAGLNGLPVKDHINKSVEEILPDHAHVIVPKLEEILASGESIKNWEYEARIAKDPDTLHSFIANYFPVKLGDKILGIGATVIDKTFINQTEKHLEKERASLKAVLEQLPLAVWIVEAPTGRIVLENSVGRNFMQGPASPVEVVEEYTAYEAYKMDGTPYAALDYPSSRALLLGETVVGEEMVIQKKNGARGFAIVSASPVRDSDGKIFAAVAVAADITEKKQSEEKLREAFRQLESQNRHLEEEKELREQFVATLSHDLRTPLTAAKVSAQLITRNSTDPTAVGRSAYRIVENMNRADGMIRDLLDASRIRVGEKLHLDTGDCDLHHIANETLDELSSVHGEKFKLLSAGPLEGRWSCSGLRRILENLCSNAIKYGSAQDPVEVRLEKEQDWVYLKVHNKGNAIPKNEQTTLFEPFRRSKSAGSSNKKGWGLGLTLVKGLTEAHGGLVAVESDSERGTTFTVKLPVDSERRHS